MQAAELLALAGVPKSTADVDFRGHKVKVQGLPAARYAHFVALGGENKEGDGENMHAARMLARTQARNSPMVWMLRHGCLDPKLTEKEAEKFYISLDSAELDAFYSAIVTECTDMGDDEADELGKE